MIFNSKADPYSQRTFFRNAVFKILDRADTLLPSPHYEHSKIVKNARGDEVGHIAFDEAANFDLPSKVYDYLDKKGDGTTLFYSKCGNYFAFSSIMNYHITIINTNTGEIVFDSNKGMCLFDDIHGDVRVIGEHPFEEIGGE